MSRFIADCLCGAMVTFIFEADEWLIQHGPNPEHRYRGFPLDGSWDGDVTVMFDVIPAGVSEIIVGAHVVGGAWIEAVHAREVAA